jgi:hypothetical protein
MNKTFKKSKKISQRKCQNEINTKADVKSSEYFTPSSNISITAHDMRQGEQNTHKRYVQYKNKSNTKFI